MMKTLEQILETGTPSEKALAQLAHQYPTNSDAILTNHLRHHLRILGVSVPVAALGIWGMYRSFTAAQETAWPVDALSFGAALGGLGGILYSGVNLVTNAQARRYRHNPDQQARVLPQTDDAVFYLRIPSFNNAACFSSQMIGSGIRKSNNADTNAPVL